MIPLWLLATLAAALVQTGRFALQKRLKSSGLSAGGATFARFIFAAPLAVGLAAVLVTARGEAMAAPPARFWIGEFHRVCEEVEQNLLELSRIGLDLGQVAGDINFDLDALPAS